METLYLSIAFPLILMAVYEGYCLSAAGNFVHVISVHLQLLSSDLSWLEKLFDGKVCLWWLVVDTIVLR